MTSAQQRTSSPELHPHIATKVSALAPEKSTRILDLGCGSGALLDRLEALGYKDLTGVDILPPVAKGTIRYEQADLDHFRLPAGEGSFDLALAVEVIEHIENPGIFLEELYRLLKPKGLLLFTTPNLHSAQSKLLFMLADRLKQFDEKGDPTHVMPIILFPFKRLLNRHGFSLLQSWAFPLDGRSPTSRPAMRMSATLLGKLMRSRVGHGDTLCMLIERHQSSRQLFDADKASLLTNHYH